MLLLLVLQVLLLLLRRRRRHRVPRVASELEPRHRGESAAADQRRRPHLHRPLVALLSRPRLGDRRRMPGLRGASVVGQLRLARAGHFCDGYLGGEAAVGEREVGGAVVGDGDAARIDGDLPGLLVHGDLGSEEEIVAHHEGERASERDLNAARGERERERRSE